MTEQEWLTATDPTPMLEFLRNKSSDRKLRLFAVACCRPYVPFDERCRAALEAAERYADGHISSAELANAFARTGEVSGVTRQLEYRDKLTVARFHSAVTSRTASWPTMTVTDANNAATSARVARSYREGSFGGVEDERTIQSGRLREVIGNPFRPVVVDPSWLSETVLALATGIYVERAFDRMPILADALEDAGCDNLDILTHLRGDEQHVKGCWALDLVLGKS